MISRGQTGLHIPFHFTCLLGFIRYLLRASFLLELDFKLFFIIWRANTHDILSLTAPARVTDSYSNDHILSSIFLRPFFFFSIHEDNKNIRAPIQQMIEQFRPVVNFIKLGKNLNLKNKITTGFAMHRKYTYRFHFENYLLLHIFTIADTFF